MAAQTDRKRRLRDYLAEAAPLAPDAAGALLRDIAAEAASWLAAGQPVDEIRIENICLDHRLRPTIKPGDRDIHVDAAAAELLSIPESGAGPQRTAVLQIGCIACELLSGESSDAYLVSPRVKQQIPAPWRPVVDRMLGYDPANQLATLQEVLAELQSPLKSPLAAETPPRGTGIDGGNTPLAVHRPSKRQAPDRTVEPLPFAMLGHYRVEAKIGSGGMGDVYRGFEPALERTVALKVLPAELGRQADFVRRFEEEAKAAARLVHPNIVQIYFIGEDAGRHYFAMQYVEGESLGTRLAREKRLPLEDALALVEQVLEGLAVAHRRGMIHRDIKPSNILLDDEHGRALLADFGLVKSLDGGTQMTATGMVMGTVDYLSPEQGRGLQVDARSDLYSIGVLLYQLLSGRLPFDADSATAIIFQHAYERPRPLADVAPHLPLDVARIVHRLLEKSPADRYPSAEELISDLRKLWTSGADKAPFRSLAQGAASRVDSPDWTLNDADEQLTAAFAPLPPISWRDRMRIALHRRAPEVVKRLQTTEQQIDGALAVYHARRDELARLEDEATVVASELTAEIQRQRRSDDGDSAERLEQALAEQQTQLEDLRFRRAQAEATLQKLLNQQALLRARLQMAAAGRIIVAAGSPRTNPRLRRTVSIGIVVAALAALALWAAGPLAKDLEPPIPTPVPPTVAASVAEPWFDVLSTVQLPEDILSGDWKWVDGGLKIDNPSGAKGLQLPVRVEGSYELRFQFTRSSGAPNRGLSVGLPVGTGWINVVVGQVSGNGVGIGGINGRSAFHNFNAATDRGASVVPDVKHDVFVSVRLEDAQTRISIELDDVPRIEWFGKQSDLNEPRGEDHQHGEAAPVLAGWGNDVTFHHLHLRPIDGAVRPIRGEGLQRAAESLAQRQPLPPDSLDGYFHVACKGAFELSVNGKPFLTHAEQTPFTGTSERVTLQRGDIVAVRVNSKYVYRAIRLAFVDVGRDWLWSARREDFRVLTEADPAQVDAASIEASHRLPESGRVDWDSKIVESWDSLIENDSSDWLWAGWKNEWAMFATVIQPELFAPPKIVIPAHRSKWTPAQNAGAMINSPTDDAGPYLSADGLTLLFHSKRVGGRGHFDLYMSRRASADQAWQAPTPLGDALNTADEEIFPRMSADGLTLLFCSTRGDGRGRRDIYQSTRSSADESWSAPRLLEAPLNTEHDDGPVWLSPDGLKLWFSSDRPGGQGKYDIWRTERESVDDPWQAPVNVRMVNTEGDQKHPTASADGELLMLDARWKSGFGQADLWSWRRPQTRPARSALNLGAAINTGVMDADPALSADGTSLWLASNRAGGQGRLDIWFASSDRSKLRPPPTGTWKLLLASGAQRPATMASAGGGAIELQSGGVFSGVYLWRDGLLVMERPRDPRFVELTWEWQGEKLVLVREPPDHPAGPAYLGATLEFVSPATSAEVRSGIPTLPARVRHKTGFH